jgi:hypothetical protein
MAIDVLKSKPDKYQPEGIEDLAVDVMYERRDGTLATEF